MFRLSFFCRSLLVPVLVAWSAAGVGRGDGTDSLAEVSEQVNRKLVKLYGSGGFKNLVHYGTGVVVSPDGYILTAASPLLEDSDLGVHLADGRRFQGRVVVAEPELDVALVKIDKVEDVPFFDLAEAAKRPPAKAGDWVLAFSNQFKIATRDEPMSVQHGVIAAYSKLHGRRGVFEAPYTGEVYVLDAVTNNPGAAGGVLTTRTGDLLGILGKELRNTLTDTWINYAVPVRAKVDVATGGRTTTVDLLGFVDRARKGTYKPVVKDQAGGGRGGYHGIVLVPSVVERTPPYVEAVEPNSPALKAGLKPDDLIVYVDGEAMASVKTFRDVLTRTAPGAVLQLEVRRVDPQTRADRLVTVTLKMTEPPGRKPPAGPK